MTGQPIVFVVKRWTDIAAVFTSEAAAVEYAEHLRDQERATWEGEPNIDVRAAPFVVSPAAHSTAYDALEVKSWANE